MTEPCRAWNWSAKSCSFVPCRFVHVCSVCGDETHKAKDAHPTTPRKQRKTAAAAATTTPEDAKAMGNDAYRAGRFVEAAHLYEAAIATLSPSSQGSDDNAMAARQQRRLECQLHINAAMARAACGQYEAAVAWLGRVLDPAMAPPPPHDAAAKALF
jgi:hypothetical protein